MERSQKFKRFKSRIKAIRTILKAIFFEVVIVNGEGIHMLGYIPPKIYRAIADSLEDVQIDIMREVEKV